MSLEALQAVFAMESGVLDARERFVLLVLAWHANQANGESWPSVSTIARETDLGRRTVQRVLPRLRRKGYLVVERIGPRKTLIHSVHVCVTTTQTTSASPRRSQPSRGRQFDTSSASKRTSTSVTVTPNRKDRQLKDNARAREGSFEEPPRPRRSRMVSVSEIALSDEERVAAGVPACAHVPTCATFKACLLRVLHDATGHRRAVPV